jgi:hypothetical protein
VYPAYREVWPIHEHLVPKGHKLRTAPAFQPNSRGLLYHRLGQRMASELQELLQRACLDSLQLNRRGSAVTEDCMYGSNRGMACSPIGCGAAPQTSRKLSTSVTDLSLNLQRKHSDFVLAIYSTRLAILVNRRFNVKNSH